MLRPAHSIITAILLIMLGILPVQGQMLYRPAAFDSSSNSVTPADTWLMKAPLNPGTTTAATTPVVPAMQLHSPAAIPAEAKFLYGFADYGDYYQVNLSKPTAITKLFSGPGRIISGCTIDGVPYGALYEATSSGNRLTDWMRMDPNTGQWTKAGVFPAEGAPVVIDMTWDPVENKVYGIGAYSGDMYSSLLLIDPVKCEITRIKPFTRKYYSIASDCSGNLYIITVDGQLSVITDKTTFEIGDVGKAVVAGAKYISSMDMDWTTNMLYWDMCDADGKNSLIKIDSRNAVAKVVGTVGSAGASKEMASVTVERYKAPAGAPARPTITSFTASGNSSNATAAWTLPTKTVGGDNLGKLDVKVYINGTLKKEYTDVEAGAQMTESFTNLSSGLNTLRVETENPAATGEWSDRITWIGMDTPTAPRNIRTTRTDKFHAFVEWDAPAAGQHGGYFDASKCKYRIERTTADGQTDVLVKVTRELSFIDSTLTEPTEVTYSIQAMTTDYGDTGYSEPASFGPPLTVPWGCQFNTKSACRVWTRHDVNQDGNCWTEAHLLKQVYNWGSSKGNGSDDWLISYPMTLEKGKTYYVYFEFGTGLGIQYPKRLEASIGRTDNYKDHKIIAQYAFAENKTQQARITVEVEETGIYYLGVHDYSVYTSASLRLSNFNVIEKTTGYIAGTVTDPDNKPMEGVKVFIPNSNIICTTGADGKYLLDYIPDGTYTVAATKYAWQDYIGQATVVGLHTTEHDIAMRKLPAYSLKGTLKNDLQRPVRNATVQLHGYGDTTYVKTNDEGVFDFGKVPSHPNFKYYIAAKKVKFYAVRDSIDIFNRDTVLNYTLETQKNAPAEFASKATDSEVTLTWKEPRNEYRYDNGTVSTQCGSLTPNDYCVFGSVFPDACVIKGVKWVTSAYQGPHYEINIWIFDVDEKKRPTKKVLFNAMHVPAEGDVVWNHYELPQALEVPNGCFVGVSYSLGMVSLAWDNGLDPNWPFHPGVNFESYNFQTNDWRCVDGTYNRRHHLLRIEAEELGSTEQVYEYHYNVWRSKAEDMLDRDKWSKIAVNTTENKASENITGLGDGEYYYILETAFGDGTVSKPLYSEAVVVNQSGINDLTGAGVPKVSPNPANGTAWLTAPADKAEVYTTSAVKVMDVAEPGMTSFDVSTLGSGMYILRLTANGKTYTSRLLIN